MNICIYVFFFNKLFSEEKFSDSLEGNLSLTHKYRVKACLEYNIQLYKRAWVFCEKNIVEN